MTSLLRSLVPITDMVARFGGSPNAADWEEFHRLYKLLALRRTPEGRYHEPNWWRGPLLFCLVREFRPRVILEFGTGRGYGAVCMAKALVEAGIEGTVYSIDVLGPDAPQQWAIDEGDGPTVLPYSRDDVWNKHLSDDVRLRIRCLTGLSADVMDRWKQQNLPDVDFCFIDAGHGYWDVKRDFLATLQVANQGCHFLFDDYTTYRWYGVNRLVDGEVVPRLRDGELTPIDTLSKDCMAPGEEVEHLMALLTASADTAWRDLFSLRELQGFQRRYGVRTFMAEWYRTLRRLYRRTLSPG